MRDARDGMVLKATRILRETGEVYGASTQNREFAMTALAMNGDRGGVAWPSEMDGFNLSKANPGRRNLDEALDSVLAPIEALSEREQSGFRFPITPWR